KLCGSCHEKIYFLYFFNSIITSSRRIQEESINLAKHVARLCETIVCLILQQYEARKEKKTVLFGMIQVKHV
ncbi:hypothetical protein K9K77_01325, partial [Candidatus Babeliales bacterium]|nr:hypothetical protein [Candidatus Babeliales bacterium]